MSKLQDQELNLPAGFRFHPTDEELVLHYLCKKCSSDRIAAPVVAEIDLYKYDPWELPGMSLYGDKEWYFFSPRDRKYPNGSRPNRAVGTGYWKATGADKPVGKPRTLAIKKALVFYAGKSPGVKTNWIMHEYRLANVDRSAGKRNNLRLDDWVLCRIYNKKGTIEKHYISDHEGTRSSDSEAEERPAATATGTFLPIASPEIFSSNEYASPEPNPRECITSSPEIQQNFDFLMTYVEDEERTAAGTFLRDASPEMCSRNEYASPESNPREYISSSPEIQRNFDFLMNYDLTFEDDVVPFVPEMLYNDQLSLFDEMFYMHQ